MTDYISYVPYVACAAIALGVIGLALPYRKPRQTQPMDTDPCKVVSDWRPTGKLDFTQTGSDAAPRFYLQTEEYRVLQSLSGTKHVEVRWRPATLDEAKRIASWNNSRETILTLPLPDAVRDASLVPTLTQEEPLAGGNEHPRIPQRRH